MWLMIVFVLTANGVEMQAKGPPGGFETLALCEAAIPEDKIASCALVIKGEKQNEQRSY